MLYQYLAVHKIKLNRCYMNQYIGDVLGLQGYWSWGKGLSGSECSAQLVENSRL